ncbi:aspartate kinase homoserine dehydrogenase [Calocera viscosa TUFC12733]|uniref:Homoserine dehydrogenase n=1 Tax=Calocera viscosa (strain TUFC12733) TaxID=1330018 RepID=A0A167L867_CALVF|nr:aspartate kinase homoserine dehydrogenase [Calocera viscosa TUFC12733]
MAIQVALVGTGLVGSAILSQLALPTIAKHAVLVSVSNSKRTVFSPNGISLPLAPDFVQTEGTVLPLSQLVSQLHDIKAHATKTVLIDSTASSAVANAYPEILRAGISIITPNKLALSSSSALYNSIQSALEADPSIRLLHESTVGAGLPIISTLNDLVKTGDKVKRIEGVFSGTLSYIFNNFSPAVLHDDPAKFSDIVGQAKRLGYTEPNPHSDLSGSDVARKLTILARLLPETPIPLPEGYLSVPTSSLSPEGLETLDDGDEYVRQLKESDAEFEEMRRRAEEMGQVLRYVGVVDAEKCTVHASLETYPVTHPFATSLGGSDNIIAFHTERYSRPLIIQGAGAGAAVTAMGVMSDLLKLV